MVILLNSFVPKTVSWLKFVRNKYPRVTNIVLTNVDANLSFWRQKRFMIGYAMIPNKSNFRVKVWKTPSSQCKRLSLNHINFIIIANYIYYIAGSVQKRAIILFKY
jgi:hypothetical protein